METPLWPLPLERLNCRIRESDSMWNENLKSLRARAFPRAVCLSAVLLGGASFVVNAADLPDGPGKAETTRVCGKCHSLDQATSPRQGQAGWKETISKMVNLGAESRGTELTAIFDYLVKNFGSGNADTATAGAPALAPPRTEGSGDAGAPDGARPGRNMATPFNPGPPLPAANEWPTYGHDSGGQRFSPLTELTPENVARLKIAWTYHMRPAGFSSAGRGFPTMEGRGPGGAVGDTPETSEGGGRGAGRGGRFGSGFRPSGDTPLVINGIMYMATPYSRVVAVDPVSGQELWSLPFRRAIRRRAAWNSGPAMGKHRRRSSSAQVTANSTQSTQKPGKPNPAFGDNGVVNLNTDAIMRGLPGRNGLSSPPVVYKNLVITGGTTQENPPHGPAGDVRAWDMRTGKLVWTFHSIPQKGEKFNDTWAGESSKNRSGVNVWGFLTVDEKRGIVYMPFGAPSVDQYGGDRAGDNLFSTSLVAANANTGKYLWHFQVVHHDIWDADMTGAPALIDVKQGGKTIPAVVAMDKTGMVFLLDRVTGKPIYGVEERPVPQSQVPLERSAKTQPFPVKPPPLARMTFSQDDIATVTPELEAGCRKLIEGVETGGPFLPPSYNHLRVPVPRESRRRQLGWDLVRSAGWISFRERQRTGPTLGAARPRCEERSGDGEWSGQPRRPRWSVRRHPGRRTVQHQGDHVAAIALSAAAMG